MPSNTAIIDTPSNLGLRPPGPGLVPDCYKMPWALRNAGLFSLLNAVDLGCVIPPRYNPNWQQGKKTRNSQAIAAYSRKLASKIEQALACNYFPILLGGDCSILLGAGLALKRRGTYGLLFLDGHSDLRHPENSDKVDAAAGEDLALSIGLGDSNLSNLSTIGPNFQPTHIAALGVRHYDAHLNELKQRSIFYCTSLDLKESLDDHIGQALQIVNDETQGFWLHIDLDVVDASEMFAADCPEPDGISFSDLTSIIRAARSTNHCIGVDVTIYDPDLDPDALIASKIVSCLSQALST